MLPATGQAHQWAGEASRSVGLLTCRSQRKLGGRAWGRISTLGPV